MSELAAYYGFNISPTTKRSGDASEMTDEQIMEALQLAATLEQLKEEQARARCLSSIRRAHDPCRAPSSPLLLPPPSARPPLALRRHLSTPRAFARHSMHHPTGGAQAGDGGGEEAGGGRGAPGEESGAQEPSLCESRRLRWLPHGRQLAGPRGQEDVQRHRNDQDPRQGACSPVAALYI